jgi:hypothetical protein
VADLEVAASAVVGSVVVAVFAASIRSSLVVTQKRQFEGVHMPHLVREQKLLARVVTFAVLFVLITWLASCNKSESSTPEKVAQKAAQKTFASPADAGTAFVEAAKSGDQTALLAIFGPDGQNVLFSGDAVKDRDALQDFVAAYNQMHRWREIKVGGEMLYTGADNFPFPIPLGQNPSGQWEFDTAAGKDEILARRIGKDELTAIAACAALADAENQYYKQTRGGGAVKQFAQKFTSDEGKQNGLYWSVSAGQPPSPLEDVRDFAKAAGYTNAGDKPQPFDGYYFRILTSQGDKAKGGAKDYLVNGKMSGGFAILAYPAEYRNSGIMAFVVGQDGIVYQKDLGEKTADIAAALTDYDPGDGWTPAI